MKRTLFLITAIFFIALATNKAHHSYYRNGVSFNYFYASLEPHGQWIEIDYDVFVWKPYTHKRNWQPYTSGRWVWTAQGWYWDSYETFGWATYHYGRWYHDDHFGWVWMPGYEWAPAWVEWRYSDNYIGWAPLSPYAAFDVHRGIHFSVRVNVGYANWHFVSYKHFGSTNVHYHYVDVHHKKRIYSNTKYRTNYYADNGRIVNGGVSRNYVERKSGVRIKTREISVTTSRTSYDKSRKSYSNNVVSYRPSTGEINRYSNIKRSNVKVERNRTSIERDKIAVKSRSGNSVERSSTKSSDSKTRVERNNSSKRNSTKTYNSRSKSATKRSVSVERNYKTKSTNTTRSKSKSISSANSINRKATSSKSVERKDVGNSKSKMNRKSESKRKSKSSVKRSSSKSRSPAAKSKSRQR